MGQHGQLGRRPFRTSPAGPIEAAAATGASRLKVLAFALLPDVAPDMVSTGLFWSEFNVRASTVLGVVAGRGPGSVRQLKNSMDLLLFPRLLTIIALILDMVTIIDHGREWVRRRLEEPERDRSRGGDGG